MNRVFIISSVLCLFLPWTLLSFAGQSKDTMLRCGNDLINIGDSKNRVVYLCGQPFSKDVIGHTKVPDHFFFLNLRKIPGLDFKYWKNKYEYKDDTAQSRTFENTCFLFHMIDLDSNTYPDPKDPALDLSAIVSWPPSCLGEAFGEDGSFSDGGLRWWIPL